MKVDMSPEAVTARIKTLDELWKLANALKSSDIVDQRELATKDRNESMEGSKVANKDIHSETSQ